MNNLERAIRIVRKAEKDKKNYNKYDKALRALGALEKRSGSSDTAKFILEQLTEALVVATEEV